MFAVWLSSVDQPTKMFFDYARAYVWVSVWLRTYDTIQNQKILLLLVKNANEYN